MEKWTRSNYQPCIPLGDNNSKITGCKKHIELSRKAACEGTVLLKNKDNVLPLETGAKVVVFGKGQIDYVKGGGGSGDVFCEYIRNIYQGLKMKKDKVSVFDPVSLYYQSVVEKENKADKYGVIVISENADDVEICPGADVPWELMEEAKKFADTAIIVIKRFSGEGWDGKNDGEDTYFELSKEEKEMVDAVCDNFKKVIVLLNTGAMIDTSWLASNDKIQAAVMIWQGGIEGGLAAADVLVGDANPSGKLVDTCAADFSDYPSSEGFHESDDYVKYTEDIFVGYRYFETVPGKKDCVVYPFGYGLSYTEFEFSDMKACCIDKKIVVSVKVKNTGKYSGKEVVQVYYSTPAIKITNPAIQLCAFAKTKLLSPDEEEVLILSFDVNDMASYDDMGQIRKSAYVLEAGEYKIFVGNSSRNITELEYKYIAESDIIVKQLTEYCAPKRLGKRMTSDGSYIDVADCDREQKSFECGYVCGENIPEEKDIKKLIDVYNGEISLDAFIEQLSDYELMGLLQGQPKKGVAATGGMGNLEKYGIPSVMTCDGPAGVSIGPETGIRTTAFPVATMLACTWNTGLLEEIGAAGAMEAKENNLSIWLAPALNIHRSPLCGRNFEYYSEDPFVSGKMAAAMVRGIQSQKIAATPKHFACNNKETNRGNSDSILSERALREIYLKGFEICVKESKPRFIMTSYNVINGVRSSESAELITGILRNEWGFDGTVMTDWGNAASACVEKIAGNDIRMPISASNDLEEKYEQKQINRNQLAVCVKRLLKVILWLD